MNAEIRIELNKVPNDLIIDFTKMDKSVLLTIQRLPEHVDHFEGPADIVIYINQHLTELLVGGLLVNAVWDSIKYAVVSTWKKNITLKQKGKGTRAIEIKFKTNADYSIEFELDGDVDSPQVEKLMDGILQYLKDTERQKKDFNNPHFRDKDDVKPRIRIRYNSKINDWEIVNLKNVQKLNEDLLKLMARRFNA